MKDMLKGILFVALFAIPFIPLIVSDTLFFPFITGKNFTFRILVEVAFAAWVLLAIYDPIYRPRFSWVAAALAGLLAVMFFANFFGEFPLKSFWSNFERMEGYVTLVHFALLAITLGSTLRSRESWNWFFNTILFASSITGLYAFAQLSGNLQINQGGWRVDGTLGNAAYMAVYMLFNVFIALLMLVRTKNQYAKFGYGALALVFLYLLIQTGTRGTALGLVGGLGLATLYTALFATQAPKIRKVALSGLVAILVLVGAFMATKDTQFVAENPILQRLASISLEAGSTRFEIWGMAFEGVMERPVLGWGQGNFNYVFNQYYQPELYGQEPWFDRVHNIVLDWLIAGGFVGLIAYLAVFVAALYHVVARARFWGDETLSVMEQGLLFGLLGAYFVHNVFVFDNVVSYMFFGIILAFIHSQFSTPIKAVEEYRMPAPVANNIAAPLVGVMLIAVVYYVNVPAIRAAGDIIDGFTAQTPQAMLTAFESALSRDSFGNQEIREQLVQRSQQVTRMEGIQPEVRNAILARVESELQKQIEEKPGDARVHVFVSAYYRSIGNLEKAREQLALARQFSPLKQQIIFEQGFTELQASDFPAALEFFRTAFELEPEYTTARVYLAAAHLYNGQPDEAAALITEESHIAQFARNNIAMNAASNARAFELLERAARWNVENEPANLQHRVTLSAVLFESGDTAASIATLETAVADFPEFAEQGNRFIEDIQAGRRPGATPAPAAVTTSSGEAIEATVE